MTLDPTRPDDWWTVHDLEKIAKGLPPIPEEFRQLREVLQRFRDGVQPVIRSAREGPLAIGDDNLTLASKDQVGQQSGALIGITPQLFYGQSNVLDDPTMENLPLTWTTLTTTAGAAAIGPYWSGHYTLVSGTDPTTKRVYRYYQRGEALTDNPFNSAQVAMEFGFGTNAAVVDAFFYPLNAYSPGAVPLLAYLIGGVKLKRETSHASTTITVRFQITDQAQTVVYAESGPLDYQSLAVYDEVRALWAAVHDPAYTPYRWRLKITMDHTAGTTSSPLIIFGEPELQMATTELLPPYTPILAGWQPIQLARFGYDSSEATSLLVQSEAYGESFPRIAVTLDGKVMLGPGSAVADVRLERTGTNAARLSKDGSGPMALTIGDTDSGADLSGTKLVLGIERAWQFVQGLSGASTELWLQPLAGDKTFNVVDVNGNVVLAVSTVVSPYSTITAVGQLVAKKALITDNEVVSTVDADQNNYNPTGLATAAIIRFTSFTAARTVTGLTATQTGHRIVLINNTSQSLVLPNESASSTAANRFRCANGASVTVRTQGSVEIIYAGGRWSVLAI